MRSKTPPELLSPWWRQAVILILIGGFAVLVWLASRTYKDAPPIPEKVVVGTGETVFTRDDIIAGQQVFLKYGLMENGTIWGHGAYLGPDFSAEYLHTLSKDVGRKIANERYHRPLDSLTLSEKNFINAGIQALTSPH